MKPKHLKEDYNSPLSINKIWTFNKETTANVEQWQF